MRLSIPLTTLALILTFQISNADICFTKPDAQKLLMKLEECNLTTQELSETKQLCDNYQEQIKTLQQIIQNMKDKENLCMLENKAIKSDYYREKTKTTILSIITIILLGIIIF